MIATRVPTVDEWIAEHGDRCEFVRGEAMEKPLPKLRHSRTQRTLTTRLTDYGERTGAGEALTEWHHRFGHADDIRIYVPDLAFILAPRDVDLPEYADSASDIMIEIVSPNQDQEIADKTRFYLENGAKRVWNVDPQRRCVEIHSADQPPRILEGDGSLTDDLLPGFELPLADLFV